MYDADYVGDTRTALHDYIRTRAGGRLPDDCHPVAVRWARDWVPFITAAHRAGLIQEPTAASLSRSLGYGDFAGLLITAVAQSVQGDATPGLVEHRLCCATRDLGDYKPAELAEIHLGDVPVQTAIFAPESVPVADLSNFTQGRVDSYIVKLLIGRQLLINGHFDVAAGLVAAARTSLIRSEGKALSHLLESNGGSGPVVGDGGYLFDSSNAISGSLDTNGLNAASDAMRAMSVAGSISGARPGVLLVPAEDEYSAAVLVEAIGNRLQLAVSPWLASGSFYCFARPSEQTSIVRLRLDGRDEPRAESARGPINADASAIEVEHSFGFVATSRLGCVKVTATP